MEPVEVIYLWKEGSKNDVSSKHGRPRLEIYTPTRETIAPRPACVVCPGGGYSHLAHHEGLPYAQLLAEQGFVTAVLTYRVAPCRFPGPYDDAARAIRIMRSLAGKYNIDTTKIAIWGSSAGSHLACTLATQPHLHVAKDDDLASHLSARPDRLILCYPVISMLPGGFGHQGSANNLLGPDAPEELRRQLSNELHVTPDNPPTFIFHTVDDPGVPVANAFAYAQACVAAGTPVELHAYETGPHGVGLALDRPALKSWSSLLVDWLKSWIEN